MKRPDRLDRLEPLIAWLQRHAAAGWALWLRTSPERNALFARLWARLSAWLLVVTWRRFIIVAVLALAAGGMVRGCLDTLSRSETIVMVDDAKPGKPASNKNVKISRDGVTIVDEKTGKRVKVGLDGVVIEKSEQNKSKIWLDDDEVVIIDPSTGKKTILGNDGIRTVDGKPKKGAKSTQSAQAPEPTQPPEPAEPPQPPQTAQGLPAPLPGTVASIPSEDAGAPKPLGEHSLGSDGDVKITVTPAVDPSKQSSTVSIQIAGREVISFSANASEAKEAAQQAAREIKEQIRETAREMADEMAKVQAAEMASNDQGDNGDEGGRSARVRVKPGESVLGEVLMALIGLSLASMVLAKVVLNTKSKAAAKVAVAEEATEREALKRQLVEAKLTTMQAQVEPHFLFNTLASVEYLIEVDPQRAAKMQHHLIDYLRAAMPHMRESTSNMGRETHLMTSFLEILKFRMEERLEFTVNIPKGLHSAEVPPMMLLSLVENCIKHGLEPKPEGGRVDIHAEITHGKLQITVADTGMGYTPDNSPTRGTGVGLANTRERLQMLFGPTASLTMGANTPCGTKAVMELPYKVQTATS